MLKHVCDRKGEVIDSVAANQEPALLTMTLTGSDGTVVYDERVELCDECLDVVQKIVHDRILLHGKEGKETDDQD